MARSWIAQIPTTPVVHQDFLVSLQDRRFTHHFKVVKVDHVRRRRGRRAAVAAGGVPQVCPVTQGLRGTIQPAARTRCPYLAVLFVKWASDPPKQLCNADCRPPQLPEQQTFCLPDACYTSFPPSIPAPGLPPPSLHHRPSSPVLPARNRTCCVHPPRLILPRTGFLIYRAN